MVNHIHSEKSNVWQLAEVVMRAQYIRMFGCTCMDVVVVTVETYLVSKHMCTAYVTGRIYMRLLFVTCLALEFLVRVPGF
jgi:hypothetical protein